MIVILMWLNLLIDLVRKVLWSLVLFWPVLCHGNYHKAVPKVMCVLEWSEFVTCVKDVKIGLGMDGVCVWSCVAYMESELVFLSCREYEKQVAHRVKDSERTDISRFEVACRALRRCTGAFLGNVLTMHWGLVTPVGLWAGRDSRYCCSLWKE